MPRIDLKSPKIQRKLTTAWFADGRIRVIAPASDANCSASPELPTRVP
jgi:hypothetical protein